MSSRRSQTYQLQLPIHENILHFLNVSWFTLLGTITYPLEKQYWRGFSGFPKVGYVSSLKGIHSWMLQNTIRCLEEGSSWAGGTVAEVGGKAERSLCHSAFEVSWEVRPAKTGNMAIQKLSCLIENTCSNSLRFQFPLSWTLVFFREGHGKVEPPERPITTQIQRRTFRHLNLYLPSILVSGGCYPFYSL